MEIKLRKMTENEYIEYIKTAVPGFAEEKVIGEGYDREEAMRIAEETFNRLLPNGLLSPDQYLFTIVDASNLKSLGILWFAKKLTASKSYAFVYDIELSEEYRGKGIGKKTMNLLEEEVKKLGLNSISLHVFGHNKVARSLYETIGFYVTNQIMSKDLS